MKAIVCDRYGSPSVLVLTGRRETHPGGRRGIDQGPRFLDQLEGRSQDEGESLLHPLHGWRALPAKDADTRGRRRRDHRGDRREREKLQGRRRSLRLPEAASRPMLRRVRPRGRGGDRPQAREALVRAGCRRPPRGAHGASGPAGQGEASAGGEGPDPGSLGRGGKLRGADRESPGRRGHRGLQRAEPGGGPLPRREPGDRLPEDRFLPGGKDLRPDPRGERLPSL